MKAGLIKLFRCACIKACLFACLLSLWSGWINLSSAQAKIKLTIRGNKFCINGQAEFLVFASYFDAPDAAYLQADLDYLQAHGINGIRVFPNWWDGKQAYSDHTLFDSLGRIRPVPMKHLQAVLDAAQARKMIVDITFSRETVKGLDLAGYKKGIIQTVCALRKYTNVFYDLQNERNGRPTFLPEKDIIALRDTLKSLQPGIILSASEAYGAAPADDIAFVLRTGLDVINYHEPRGEGWWNLTYSRVRQLGVPGLPVYLGEPGRWTPGGSITARDLLTAIRGAKKAGAAAWTFHNEACFDLDHVSLASRLDPAVEKAFLDSLPSVLSRVKWDIN